MNRSMRTTADVFATEAAWMAKLRAGRGFNPVTSMVQVSTVLNALHLRRTDFEQYRETVVPAIGVGQATITVDAAKLAAILKGGTGPVGVDIDDGLSITLAGRTVRLRAADVEFPPWPGFEPTDEPAVLAPSQVARVLTSVGTDDALPTLTAVAFDDGAMVATDRFRLTRVTYAESGFLALVPGDALRAFANGSNAVTVTPGRGESDQPLIRLSSGERSIIVPMPDHDFPKWQQLIPDEPPVRAMVRRDDLLTAAGGEYVVLTMNGDTMRVCGSSDNGDVEIEQKIGVAMVRGDEFEVKLRTQYLTESLRGVGCSAVALEATAPDKPVIIQDVGETTMHLIMPIRPK